MDLKPLYRNIEAERARKKWTTTEAASRLGISEKQYRNRITNEVNITVQQLLNYSEVFGVSVDYLLGLTDKINIA